jgi:predicted DNA-binding transcriptional regulator AlpA
MEQMDRIIHIKETSELTGIPESTLRYYRALSQGANPQYIGPQGTKIGKRLVWKESQVRAWLDEQFAKSEAK